MANRGNEDLSLVTKIVIHAGFAKTGSSAIQAFMAGNQDLLDSLGLFYKCPELTHSTEITSGNAVLIYKALSDFKMSDLLAFLEQHTSPGRISILSSEILAHLTIDQWYAFKKTCEANHFKIEKIVSYVRNVDSFLMSAYDQLLKRHGFTQDFDQFAAEYLWEHYNASFKMLKIFDQDTLTFLHYESQKNSILYSFFSQMVDISPQLEQQLMQASKVSVNRSLTKLERFYMVKLNSQFGDLHSQKLSDRFILHNPDFPKDEMNIDEKTRNIIMHCFHNQVNWMNKNLFYKKPTLLICTPTTNIKAFTNISYTTGKIHRIFNDYVSENNLRL